jgi:hypothetical protein
VLLYRAAIRPHGGLSGLLKQKNREKSSKYYEKEVTAMDNKLVKWLGIGATAIGMGATLLSNWVSGKQEDDKIEKKVAEAVAKLTSKEG